MSAWSPRSARTMSDDRVGLVTGASAGWFSRAMPSYPTDRSRLRPHGGVPAPVDTPALPAGGWWLRDPRPCPKSPRDPARCGLGEGHRGPHGAGDGHLGIELAQIGEAEQRLRAHHHREITLELGEHLRVRSTEGVVQRLERLVDQPETDPRP